MHVIKRKRLHWTDKIDFYIFTSYHILIWWVLDEIKTHEVSSRCSFFLFQKNNKRNAMEGNGNEWHKSVNGGYLEWAPEDMAHSGMASLVKYCTSLHANFQIIAWSLFLPKFRSFDHVFSVHGYYQLPLWYTYLLGIERAFDWCIPWPCCRCHRWAVTKESCLVKTAAIHLTVVFITFSLPNGKVLSCQYFENDKTNIMSKARQQYVSCTWEIGAWWPFYLI